MQLTWAKQMSVKAQPVLSSRARLRKVPDLRWGITRPSCIPLGGGRQKALGVCLGWEHCLPAVGPAAHGTESLGGGAGRTKRGKPVTSDGTRFNSWHFLRSGV